jgi:hypothetical protein
MLIDEGVVWPVSAAVSYGAIDVHAAPAHVRSLKVWLHFALLHELGHRSLHSGIVFRLRRVSEGAVETEADLFALRALEQLATAGEYDEDSQFSVLNVSKDLAGRDRSAAVVASLIQSLSVTLLFGGSQFSPFHADTAHDAFVTRFRPRLYEALAQTTASAARSYVLLALAYLDRVEATGRGVTAELYTAEPIQDVAFDGSDLVITTAGAPKAKTYRVVASGLVRASGRAAQILLPDAAHSGSVVQTSGAKRPVKPQSGLVLVGHGLATEWRLVDERGAVLAARTHQALRNDLKTQYGMTDEGLAGCVTDDVLSRSGHIDVTFTCREDREFGSTPHYTFYVGELDPHDLRLEDLTGITANGRQEGDAQTLLDMRIDGVRHTYVVTDTVDDERHARRFEVRVAPLWPAGGLMPVARMPLVVDWIPTGGVLDKWLRVSHPAVIDCTDEGDGLATCTEFLDSVFAFDARARTLTTLFYPAGALMVRGPGRQHAFYAPNGHKVFVVEAAPFRGPADATRDEPVRTRRMDE